MAPLGLLGQGGLMGQGQKFTPKGFGPSSPLCFLLSLDLINSSSGSTPWPAMPPPSIFAVVAVLATAVVRVGVIDDACSFYPLGFDSGACPWSVPPPSRTLGFEKDAVAAAAILPAVVCRSLALQRPPP